MRRSELEKLKKLFDMGKNREEILKELEPRRGNGNGYDPPKGGISQSEASRKYGVTQSSISQWVRHGYIPVLLRTKREVYIDEARLVEVIKCYKASPGQGKKTVKHQFAV